MAEKRNPDYSATAVNLCNPAEVCTKLTELHAAQENIAKLDSLLQAMPEYEDMKKFEKKAADITAQIKDMVDHLGSYQDTEAGTYALKYKRVSKSYNAERFKANYEKLAPAVIVEQVNVKALEGLIKGGLVTETDLDTHQIIERTESYAYIVK